MFYPQRDFLMLFFSCIHTLHAGYHCRDACMLSQCLVTHSVRTMVCSINLSDSQHLENQHTSRTEHENQGRNRHCIASVLYFKSSCPWPATQLHTLPSHIPLYQKYRIQAKTMSTTTVLCWACSYSDSEDQADCLICSSSSSTSSPSSYKTYLLNPNTSDLRWSLPAISATKLQKIWQRCGSENTAEWREALDFIRTLNPKRLCTSFEKADPGFEGKTAPTISLQDSDYFEGTPSITLTSASPTSIPTMNLTTWHTFEQRVWSTTDVHVTTMQRTREKHRGKRRHCESCMSDVEVNREWAEAMSMGGT